MPAKITSSVAAMTARWPIHLLAILALGVGVYSNSFDVPFQFDDEQNIVLNPALRQLPSAAEVFSFWVPSKGLSSPSRAVAFFTFALNIGAHGYRVWGFHAVNLAIHLLAALFVYLLFMEMASSPRCGLVAKEARWGALLAALFFVAHPLQTQAVTYIVQRMASLAALLYLVSIYCHARSRRAAGPRGRAWVLFAAGLGTAFLALLSKESAFTLPAAILLYDMVFLEGSWPRRLALCAPVLLVTLGVAAGMAAAVPSLDSMTRAESDLPRLHYLYTELRVIVLYLRLLIFPIGQSLEHDVPLARSLFDARVLGSLALLLCLAAAALVLVRSRGNGHRRMAGFGLLFFLLALSVESGIFPISDVVFEHRLYLPSFGFFAAGAALLLRLRATLTARRPRLVLGLNALLAMLIVGLGVATLARNRIWRDPLTLWTDAVRHCPRCARAHFELGNHLRETRGDLAGAEREWRAAVALTDGRHPAALNSLGNVRLLNGDRVGAEAYYRRALANPEARYNLARLLARDGRWSEARMYFMEFIRQAPPWLGPQVEEARKFLGQFPPATSP